MTTSEDFKLNQMNTLVARECYVKALLMAHASIEGCLSAGEGDPVNLEARRLQVQSALLAEYASLSTN